MDVNLVLITYLHLADNYKVQMFKFNNKNIRTKCEICSELRIKTSEMTWHHWTYFTPRSSAFIVNFEQVNAGRLLLQ